MFLRILREEIGILLQRCKFDKMFFDPNDEWGYLKKLLKDRYGCHISFSEESGKETLIYFLDMENFILNTKFKEKAQDIKEESERNIKTAANLIKAEIRERSQTTSSI